MTKKTLSSKNKIIFLGNTKAAEDRLHGTRYHYEEHGMRYGWIGNHAFINLDKLKSGQRKGFVEFYAKKAEIYKDRAKDYAKNNESKIGKNVALAWNVLGISSLFLYGLPGLVIGAGAYATKAGVRHVAGKGADQIINSVNTVKDLSGYQYQLLLREFVFNGLDKFMEV